MSTLRAAVIRLASKNPGPVRKALLPLLKKTAAREPKTDPGYGPSSGAELVMRGFKPYNVENFHVFEPATVTIRARVKDTAKVWGRAFIMGDATVSGNARVYQTARVGGNAVVTGNATVRGRASVAGDAVVGGTALIEGTAVILGGTWDGSEGPVDVGTWKGPGVPA
jgi:UDP-3-O-[3-hydroxymyristoyl] glucosamine N-acyltransferase